MEHALKIVTLRKKYRNLIAPLLGKYFALKDVFVQILTKNALKTLTVPRFAILLSVQCLFSAETVPDYVFQIGVNVKVALALHKKLNLCKIRQTFIKDLTQPL